MFLLAYYLKISDTSDLDKAVDVVDHNAARARDSMTQAVGLIVQMDESLKEEEQILQQRANRLRRQSADAFKLMNDINKVQQCVPKFLLSMRTMTED